LQAISEPIGGVSGDLRAAGSPQIDDLGSPRGTGRPETGRSPERGAVPRSDGAGPVALAVLEAADDEAGELIRDCSLRSPLRALNSPGLPRDPVMQIKRESA